MDGLIAFLLLLALLVVVGGIFGWISFFRLNSLDQSYRQLAAEFKKLKQQLANQSAASQAPKPDPTKQSPDTTTPRPAHKTVHKTSQQTQTTSTGLPESETPFAETSASETPASETPAPPKPRVQAPSTTTGATAARHSSQQPQRPSSQQLAPQPGSQWLSALIDNWMIWLGGISVALAGIFMVKYSINMGLLGPKTQISLAIITGLLLHAVADWLRRRNGGSDPVFASLAGGASITLYAALLAALHIYHLISPGWAFVLLAIVSLSTMGLSLLHGPMLAMIGLVGAYVVPILVSTNSGNMIAALTYSLIISGAALLLIRFVYRPWLWWSIIIGSMGWWLISLPADQADNFRSVYLAILAWALLAIPHFDVLLRGKSKSAIAELDNKNIKLLNHSLSKTQFALLAIVVGWAISLFWQGHEPWQFDSVASFALWAPLVIVLIVASNSRQSLWALPWISLLLHTAAWFAIGFEPSSNGYQFLPLANELSHPFLIFAGSMTVLYSALSAWQWQSFGFTHPRASLAILAPLVWFALSYAQVSGLTQSPQWSTLALVMGLIYATIAAWRLKRQDNDPVALWLILAAHFAYSLAAIMFFREALLSLAIAAQLLSLAWLIKRYQLPWLELFLKITVSIIVLRLTLNPWLADYPADVHWSLYTYGGSTLFAFLASRQLADKAQLKLWLEAAALHLFVLTLGTELRYWLYDGDIFSQQYCLTESAINTSLWAALSLTYFYRAGLSESLRTFYLFCSKLLLILSSVSYLVSVTRNNPWWSDDTISSIPLFNILLLAYGAPIIWALLVAFYHDPHYRSFALRIAGFASLLFITLEIRQLWQGGDLSLGRSTSDGEIYTYSVVWMLMAIPTVLLGARWKVQELYKAGMILLVAVIGKIFLIDMSGLDGLWRVASFMGLGLTLLALAWFYKKVKD